MTRASTLPVVVALLAACQQGDGPSAPSTASSVPLAAAVTHFRDKVFFTNDLVVENPCTGEDVLLHLDQVFMIKEVSVEEKFFHGHITFLDRGTIGEGLTSGATYRQTGAEQDMLHLKGEVASSQRFENTLNIISQGSAPNFLVHEIFRLMVSPAGEVKIEFQKVREVCRG
jgi:hypothetical protein